jgi:hypothetical protein
VRRYIWKYHATTGKIQGKYTFGKFVKASAVTAKRRGQEGIFYSEKDLRYG